MFKCEYEFCDRNICKTCSFKEEGIRLCIQCKTYNENIEDTETHTIRKKEGVKQNPINDKFLNDISVVVQGIANESQDEPTKILKEYSEESNSDLYLSKHISYYVEPKSCSQEESDYFQTELEGLILEIEKFKERKAAYQKQLTKYAQGER